MSETGIPKKKQQTARPSIKGRRKKPIWITTTIATNWGREELLAATFKEIILHLIFLVLLSVYIFGQTNNSEYYLSLALKDAFDMTAFKEVITVEKFWEYLQENALVVFHETAELKSHQRSKKTKQNVNAQFFSNNTISSSSLGGHTFIVNENLLLGVPRLRQVKVTDNSCEIHGYFRRLFVSCYDEFSDDAEDRKPFGLKKATAWVYSDATKTKSLAYWGTLTTYSGGGFYVDLSTDSNISKSIIKELHDNLWITRGTRAIFLDFSVYNANVNLFCVCKLTFEFLPSGLITQSYQFSPITLTPFNNIKNWVLRILFYIFCVYALYCSCEEVREMIYFRGKYFTQFWNYVDLTMIMLTFPLLIGTEYLRLVANSYIDEIFAHPNSYGNLEVPRLIFEVVRICGATLLFLIYLRTFKYLNFNRRMAQLNNTIRNCAKDILGFSVMFFVAYFAFAQLGYLVFGNELEDFRSFGQAMFTLLRAILGDFNYSEIQEANWIVAPIYFLSYIMLVFFILLNMFLAIINDTYIDVKKDIAIAPNEMHMSDYLSKKIHNILKKLGCRVAQEEKKEHAINANLKEIRDALVRCNFADREIEMYFARYDIDPLKDLSKEQVETFFELLAKEDSDKEKSNEEAIVTWKDFQRQDDTLEELENSLVVLGHKVEELVQTIKKLQEPK